MSDQMRPGERLGDYTIISWIGEGGMSVVYLAEHAVDQMRVVVKELREQFRFNSQLVDRFVRGAEILQDLRHSHLARVYACFERDNKNYMVEEYLPGGTLADAIDQGRPYSEKEILTWCRDALRALDYANEHGIVHRDVKPSNLMLDERGQIKVIDFGIARVFGAIDLTRAGDVPMGTVEYMSPEQILVPDQVIHLTDVYSMGIVLYELLTGRVPFQGGTPFEIMEQVTRHSPPSIKQLRPGIRRMNPNLGGIHPKLAKIIYRAIDKCPERRFGGCGEFAVHLDRLIKETPQSWPARLKAALTGSAMLRRPTVIGASLLFVLLVLWFGNGRWQIRSVTSWFLGDGAANRAASAPPVAPDAPPIASPPPAPTPPPGPSDVPKPPPAPPEVPVIQLAVEVHPAEVRAAGVTVTYTYFVSNAGTLPLRNVSVVDGGTSPILGEGDVNHDRVLDVGERWVYKTAMVMTQAHLDRGGMLRRKAEASADGATSPSQATEVSFRQNPAIDVEAFVNGAKTTELTGPGPVTLTFDVRNTGNVSLTGVRLADQPDIVPVLAGGDTDKDNVLDVDETWHYRSRLMITPAQLDAAGTLVRRAVAVSNQVRSDPDVVRLAFAKPITPAALPEKTKHVQPEYPAEARAAGVQGVVRLGLTVGRDGLVKDAQVVQSIPLLDEAALAAAKQWTYAPTLKGGVPVPVQFDVSVRFTLAPPQPPAPPPAAPTSNSTSLLRTNYVAPVYPLEAQKAGVQGNVTIVLTIAPDGRVQDARIVQSVPLLDKPALDAVRQWRYAPTGVAVPITLTVTLQFSIGG